MKILRIIASMDPKSGGPCQGIRNTASALSRLGVQNEVVCVDAPDSDYLGNDIFPIYALGPATNPWGYAPKLLPWLIENISQFDAVIVHGLWLYPSYAAKKAMRELAELENSKAIPWYIMPHGMLDPYFQNAPDRKIKALRNSLYWKVIENKVVQSASALLFTCQEELLLARQPFTPYKPQKEINVGYGIQPPPAYTGEMTKAFLEKCKLESDEKYLLFLSRIHPKKGVDNLILAYKELLENSVNSLNHMPNLVIAGPGMETAFGKEMLSIVEESEILNKRVFFPGMLKGKAKWGAFYGCDAFILPSHQENFGIAVAEALACKKSVLISNKINIWREIKESGGGIVHDDNLKGTRELLSDWIKLTKAEKDDFADKAFLTFQAHFRIEKNIETLVKALWPDYVIENMKAH